MIFGNKNQFLIDIQTCEKLSRYVLLRFHLLIWQNVVKRRDTNFLQAMNNLKIEKRGDLKMSLSNLEPNVNTLAKSHQTQGSYAKCYKNIAY